MARASQSSSPPPAQHSFFFATPRSTKSPPRSPAAPKAWFFPATEIFSMQARVSPALRLSPSLTGTRCSSSDRFPTLSCRACILKSKRLTRPNSSSELPIAVSASSTPRVPARFLPPCRRLRLRPQLNLRRDHSPAARQHFSSAKISSRPPKLNLASSSHRPPPSVPRRFKSPLRQALRTVLSTSPPISPAAGWLSRPTRSVMARKFWKFSPPPDRKLEASQSKSTATVSALTRRRSPQRLAARLTPCRNASRYLRSPFPPTPTLPLHS